MQNNHSQFEPDKQERIGVMNNPLTENKIVISQRPPEELEDDPFDEGETGNDDGDKEDDPFEISVPNEDEDQQSETIEVDENYPGLKESDID